MALRRREFLSAGLLALSGCSAVGESSGDGRVRGPARWNTYGRGPTHRASYEDGSIPSQPPTELRSIELTGSRATSPVASKNYLAVGDERGVLVVPSADERLPRWAEPPGTVAGTPILDGETIYVTSYGMFGDTDTAHVSAMTIAGKTTWQTDLSGEMVTMATLRDDTVFARTDEAYLALDADSGEIRWRTPTTGPLEEGYLAFENFGPAAGSDVVVFPDLRELTAIDPADGTIRWRHRLRKVRSCPVIADEIVYVADVHSGVHAFDAATGDRTWHWSGTGCWSPPAVADGQVYTTEGNDVVALDQQSGDLAWRTGNHGLHGDVQSGVSVIGETVLVSSTGVGLAAVRTDEGRSGTKRWTLGESGFDTPLVVGDHIAYVEYGGETPTLRILR